VRHVIITADDFGLDVAINEAVEKAFDQGILTTASLMIGQAASLDAVERARRLPRLRVGLHVTLTGARPLLPPARIPDLVDAQGHLPTRLAAFGAKLAWSRAARRQAQAEIRAQFEAFAATGLELDHANAHQHFHLHPFVIDTIVRIGGQFGLRAVRVPYEPLWLARGVPAAAPRAGRVEGAVWAIGARWMRRKLRSAGLACNDYLFGLRCTGQIDETTMCEALHKLRPGVVELYLHPATRAGARELAAGVGAHAVEEFASLTSLAARASLLALDASVGGYRDIPRTAFASLPAAAA